MCCTGFLLPVQRRPSFDIGIQRKNKSRRLYREILFLKIFPLIDYLCTKKLKNGKEKTKQWWRKPTEQQSSGTRVCFCGTERYLFRGIPCQAERQQFRNGHTAENKAHHFFVDKGSCAGNRSKIVFAKLSINCTDYLQHRTIPWKSQNWKWTAASDPPLLRCVNNPSRTPDDAAWPTKDAEFSAVHGSYTRNLYYFIYLL